MRQLLRTVLTRLGTFCLMTVSGVGWFIVSVLILMGLGGRFHGAYDHYGRYPALFLIPTAVGFFAPLVFLWWREVKGVQGRRAFLQTLWFVLVLFLVPIILFCVFWVWMMSRAP